jgi:hypothetical protein
LRAKNGFCSIGGLKSFRHLLFRCEMIFSDLARASGARAQTNAQNTNSAAAERKDKHKNDQQN